MVPKGEELSRRRKPRFFLIPTASACGLCSTRRLPSWYSKSMIKMRFTGDALWERIERAVQKVKDRLERVTTALDAAEIPYAVIGGNAVQIWVAQVDEAAVRNTRDVDILLDRDRLDDAITALAKVGFVYQVVTEIPMFLDGPEGTPRDAVHIVFAGEKVREDYAELAPRLDQCERPQGFSTLPLEDLVRMKLTSHRLKDRVHLLDMLSIGLIDETWPKKFAPGLQSRLQALIDNPDG